MLKCKSIFLKSYNRCDLIVIFCSQENDLISCTFTLDTCGWYNDRTANFSWTRQQGATVTDQTGPSFDHTTLSPQGWYMYIGNFLKDCLRFK